MTTTPLHRVNEMWDAPIQAIIPLIGLENFPEEWEAYPRKCIRRPPQNRNARQEPFVFPERVSGNELFLTYYPPYGSASEWIMQTNWIRIGWDREYTLTGPFVKPVRGTAEQIATEFRSQFVRTVEATNFNATLELIEAASLYDSTPEEIFEAIRENPRYGRSPAEVHRVGPKTITRWAQSSLTVYNLTKDLSNKRMGARGVDYTSVHKSVKRVLERYEQLRQLDGWDFSKADPDRWSDYPFDEETTPWDGGNSFHATNAVLRK